MLAAVAHGGDYNLDLSVDAADYVVWRKAVGQSIERYSCADGDGSGIVVQGDFNGWRANFGRTGPPQPIIDFVEFEAEGSTQLVLEIVGSDLGDTLTIGSGANPQDIQISYQNSAGADVEVDFDSATINAKVLETGLEFRGVYVRGLAVSDTIDLGDLNVRAIVEAGNGGDPVTGGSQADLILGVLLNYLVKHLAIFSPSLQVSNSCFILGFPKYKQPKEYTEQKTD